MRYLESLENLIEFARHSERLYIYGAGHFGTLCRTCLEKQQLSVNGFVLSEMPEAREVDGISVQSAKNILPELASRDGIILAMKPEFQAEVIASLGIARDRP